MRKYLLAIFLVCFVTSCFAGFVSRGGGGLSSRGSSGFSSSRSFSSGGFRSYSSPRSYASSSNYSSPRSFSSNNITHNNTTVVHHGGGYGGGSGSGFLTGALVGGMMGSAMSNHGAVVVQQPMGGIVAGQQVVGQQVMDANGNYMQTTGAVMQPAIVQTSYLTPFEMLLIGAFLFLIMIIFIRALID